jgi:hypothetical protein
MIFADLTFRPHVLPPHWRIASGATECGLWFNVVEETGKTSNFLRLRYRLAKSGPVTGWDFDDLVTRDQLRQWMAGLVIGAWPLWAGRMPEGYQDTAKIGLVVKVSDPPKKRQTFRHARSSKTAFVLERLKEGATVEQVATDAGITKSRVYQIIQRDKAEQVQA